MDDLSIPVVIAIRHSLLPLSCESMAHVHNTPGSDWMGLDFSIPGLHGIRADTWRTVRGNNE